MMIELVPYKSFTLTTWQQAKQTPASMKWRSSGIGIGSFLFNMHMCDLPSTIFRKFAYAADLALLHSLMIWKSRHDYSVCVQYLQT